MDHRETDTARRVDAGGNVLHGFALAARGEQAAAILTVLERASGYPHCRRYRYWPGPNSNSFVAAILRYLAVAHYGRGRVVSRSMRRDPKAPSWAVSRSPARRPAEGRPAEGGDRSADAGVG